MTRQLLTTFLFFSSLACHAQSFLKIDSLFQSYYRKGLFEGTALVADSSGIIYHKSFGYANHNNKILNDTGTIFRLGSLEKQFTAMLVLQLIETGQLSLQGKISHYLPSYRKETGTKVNIEQLLTHTSGIPSYTALPNLWDDPLQLSYQPEYILQHFCSGDLEFPPGTRYKYSNTGYFILAQVIEKITGKPLATVLREQVLVPAGMNKTGLEDNLTPIQDKAHGYYRLGNTYRDEPYIYVPNSRGAASIYSTAYDLYLWDRILYGSELLPQKAMQSYLSPHFNIDPGYSYGFGWEFTKTRVGENDTVETMEHSGAIRAFRAVIFRIPAEKKCIILLSNCANQSAYSLFENLVQIQRGGTWKEPQKLLADTLYSILQKGSVAEAIAAYRDLKRTDSTNYDFSTSSLEFFGERLFQFQNYEAATAFFHLAVDQNPKYTSGYYYLGKAYEKWGKRAEAIKAYRKAASQGKNSRPGVDAAFQLKYLESQHTGRGK